MRPRYRRRGFTLLELLVVLTIVLVISVITLPAVHYAYSHRQTSEAARILQGALVGARDDAIHTNGPSGIRLLPDPAFPLVYLPNGQLDPSQPIAANRIIPIAPAPDYQAGKITQVDTSTLPAGFMPYPALMLAEAVVDPTSGLPNEPTSWFWNIRVGDKIQLGNAGKWYTIVGPMVITPAAGNPQMFVNVGAPGTRSPYQVGAFNPEFLWLVNGRDDNGNGWIDEGFDGLDNNHNGVIDEVAEWEAERW